VRLRIIKRTRGEIDGIPLDRFEVGAIYDVGTTMGSYLLALGAAVPVADGRPALVIPLDIPARRVKVKDNGRVRGQAARKAARKSR
jgi:hypothetical protein